MIFEIVKILEESLEDFLVSKNLHDTITVNRTDFSFLNNIDLVKIAPYDELTFGTSISILISRSLKKKGISLNPNNIAEHMIEFIKNKYQQSWSVFCGEEAFINFQPKVKSITTYCKNLISGSASEFLDKLLDLQSMQPVNSLNQKFEKELELRSINPDLVDEVFSKYSSMKEKKIISLHFIADTEMDLNFMLSDDRFGDNALYVYNSFTEVTSSLVGRGSGSFDKNGISITGHALDNAEKLILSLFNEIKNFIVIFPFKFSETSVNRSLESFYQIVLRLMKKFLHCFNDRTVRYYLRSPHPSFRNIDLVFLRESLFWVSNLKESYLEKGINFVQ